MNTNIPRTVIIALLATFLPLNVFAQSFNSKVAADVSAGYVFPTHKFLRGNNKADKPINSIMSAHVKYGFQFGDNSSYGKEYPYTYQGVGLSYNTFFNKEELGSPIALYIFQHSRIISLCQNLAIDYEWDFGISWNWNPYSSSNYYNETIGSKVNAYINLGFMFNWQLAKQWNLTAGAEITHFSNGNTTYPNYGVNALSFKAGITRSFGNESTTSKKSYATSRESHTAKDLDRVGRRINYDLVLYGAWHEKVINLTGRKYEIPGSFATFGLNLNPLYNFNRFFRAGVSLDLQYDKSANMQNHITNKDLDDEVLDFENVPFGEQIIAGISLRGEVVMPIFSVNVGMGHNFYAKGEEMDAFYQLLALKASITKQFFLHIGCQFYDFKEPHNLMLGFGYRF